MRSEEEQQRTSMHTHPVVLFLLLLILLLSLLVWDLLVVWVMPVPSRVLSLCETQSETRFSTE